MEKSMDERRGGARHMISFPIRLRWKDESGKEVVQEGLTENVGPQGTLVYLPRNLPLVGGKVQLTVTENPDDEVTVVASVIRLERNASHPQAALQLIDGIDFGKRRSGNTPAGSLLTRNPNRWMNGKRSDKRMETRDGRSVFLQSTVSRLMSHIIIRNA